ncbi:MAG: hypothetical protein RQ729_00220 [Wenzhouxiangellaceae bacterium]|nr:hypothetical protein [Wenzhouxiangellaceae bacterium]
MLSAMRIFILSLWLSSLALLPLRADDAALLSAPNLPRSAVSDSAWFEQRDWLDQRLAALDLRLGAPLHIRIFKQSRELELYLHDGERYALYRSFPICDMSGGLGPKRFEGDYQAPEGFYDVVPGRLHPHSDFHLAFNLGYPNDLDRAFGHTGSNIMIHGDCASNGCFAMTDYYMEQLYVLAEAAFRAGQREIGVEIFPFRMTDDNLAAHAESRWMPFWETLKPAWEHFERHRVPARMQVTALGYRIDPDSAMPPALEPARAISAP